MSIGPTYTVEFTREARKTLAKLPKDAREAIGEKINAPATDPRPHGCLKLTNSDGLYRIRVGNFRVIDSSRDTALVVHVFKVGDRKDVYEGP